METAENFHSTHNASRPHVIPSYTNYTFACIYILCMTVGLPGNLVSLQYFVTCARSSAKSGNKAFFNTLYILISMVDVIVCSTLVPVIVSFLHQRADGWFACALFCQLWGILWEMLPFISVFLVGFMSISRTVVLMKPLCQLEIKLLWALNFLYCTFLILRTACPIWLNAAKYEYVYSDVYCYELPTTDWSYKFNSISRSLTLAAPVVPICISCTTSYVIILLNERRQSKVRRPSRARLPLCSNPNGVPEQLRRNSKKATPMNATMTIVIFTIAYIVFNIPVFINYLLMSIAGWSKNCVSDCYHKTYGKYPVLIWYSWNFTYVTCVAVNSMINPLIYYWRMPSVKDFVNVKIRNTSRALLDLQTSQLRKRVSSAFSLSSHQTLTTVVADSLAAIPDIPELSEVESSP